MTRRNYSDADTAKVNDDTINKPAPEFAMYMGKSVDEMTREELIAAVKLLGRLYNTALSERVFNRESRLHQPQER